MRRWPALMLVLGLLAGLMVWVAPSASAVEAKRKPRHPVVKDGVYKTPGYKGSRAMPSTGPAPAPPSITLSDNGERPDVLVDRAGTAHVVWTDATTEAVLYCRIPRGATACDNPSQTPFDRALTPSTDFTGPRILQVGDGLVVLTSRYPIVVQHPDGQTSSRTLYAYTSVDGGTTWSAPAIVGTQEPQGGAVVFGGANARIAVISDTQTGGTVVQTVTPGLYTRAGALLGPGDEAYSGRLAPDGEGLVAAFTALSGYGVVRRLPAGGNPADANAWSRTVVPDTDEVELASGPSGVFLMGRPLSGGPFLLRPVVDGVPGEVMSTLPAPASGTGPIRDLVQDASGGLHAFYRDGIGNVLYATDSTDAGRTWSPVREIARSVTLSAVDSVQAAAAADGGGVVVYRRDPTGLSRGTIAATAFGTLSPTGQPGAGGLAGQGIPGAYAGCEQVTFGRVRVTPEQGCLLPSVDPAYPGAAVSAGPIDLNGLRIVPDAGVRILVNPRTKSLDTTGKVSVVLRGPGIDLTLLRAELHMRIPNDTDGGVLFDIDPAGLDLAGFPIAGRVQVLLTGTGARVPVSLSLPGAFGGVSGSATLVLESGRGVRLDSVVLSLKRAPIGPLELRDLVVSYSGASDTWRGAATLGLPPQPGGASLSVDVTFVKGRFTAGSFAVGPPFPGAAIGPNVYLTQIRGGFGLDPIKIAVGASFGAFPIAPPNAYTVSVDGDLVLTVTGQEVVLTYTGTGRVAGVALQRVVLNATTAGYADITAGYDVDLKVVGLSGNLQGFVDGPAKRFGATADVDVRIAGLPAVGQRAALSHQGIGACYTVGPTSFMAGYRFGQPIPGGVDVGASLDGCNLTAYEVPRPTRARPAAGEGPTFDVARGTRIRNVELTAPAGAAPPTVTLLDPSGAAVTPTDVRATGNAAGPAVALTLPEAGRTVVALRDPAPGTWTVVPSAGSSAIEQLRVSRDAARVTVSARVSGGGDTRVLRYRVRNGAGATVTFAERGSKGAVGDLGAAKGAAGSIRFTPADGPGGRREIVATVSRGGIPVDARVVTRYRAPATARPATVTGVRAARTGRAVKVAWRPVDGAHRYVIRVAGKASDRVLIATAGRKARSVTVRGVTVDDGRLTVGVAAQDVRGRTGRPGRARA